MALAGDDEGLFNCFNTLVVATDKGGGGGGSRAKAAAC